MAETTAAAAAKSEKTKKAKTYTWRGIKLTLPATLPGTLLWDLRNVEEDPVGFLEAFVGEEQSLRLRAKVAADELGLEEVAEEFREIVGGILKKYGLGPGKSLGSEQPSTNGGSS